MKIEQENGKYIFVAANSAEGKKETAKREAAKKAAAEKKAKK